MIFWSLRFTTQYEKLNAATAHKFVDSHHYPLVCREQTLRFKDVPTGFVTILRVPQLSHQHFCSTPKRHMRTQPNPLFESTHLLRMSTHNATNCDTNINLSRPRRKTFACTLSVRNSVTVARKMFWMRACSGVIASSSASFCMTVSSEIKITK